MVNDNRNLHRAKSGRKDEFYTTYEDIEKEVSLYGEAFSGASVYCNCDDFTCSNFYKYFKNNFNTLSLKKLTVTSYSESGHGRKCVYDGIERVSLLEGDGDFRSPECIGILSECDIVCTNPPFSLLREYMTMMMESGKRFLILGNQNVITHMCVFPYLKDNKVWFGQTISGGDRKFHVPSDYPLYASVSGYDGSVPFVRVSGVRWLTNMENPKRNEQLELTRTYDSELYPKYANADMIEVGRTSDIPCDYNGLMAVPVTFLDHYNPEQFEIVSSSDFAHLDIEEWRPASQEFVDLYYSQGNRGVIHEGWTLPHYVWKGNACVPYKRIIIRKRIGR